MLGLKMGPDVDPPIALNIEREKNNQGANAQRLTVPFLSLPINCSLKPEGKIEITV